MAAARAGSHKVLHWLLQHGADTEATARDGTNALHAACSHGRKLAVQLLLEFGADIAARTAELAQTPLHLAAESGELEIVRFLVENGAPINAVADRSWTALTHAIAKHNLPVVSYLLDMGAHIATLDLHKAAESGDPDLVVLLLDHGADVSAVGNGKPPENSVSGTEPVTQQQPGFTALHVASRDGNVQVAKALLDRGADPTATTGSGHTALHFACFAGSTDLVRLLLGRGVEIEAKANDGSTALHIAVCYGQPITRLTVVRLLLDHGATVSAVDELEQTALHRLVVVPSVHHVRETVARLLCDRGLDVNAKRQDGKSAVELCSDDALRNFLVSSCGGSIDVSADI